MHKDIQIVRDLQQRLQTHASEKTKKWFEDYLKGVIPYRGLKTPLVLKVLKQWVRAHELPQTRTTAQLTQLSLGLLREEHAEDKFAGILLLQHWCVPDTALDWCWLLEQLAQCFDDGAIYDWSTCDWLCMRVLRGLIRVHGKPCAEAIAGWCHASNLWRRRASGVAFVGLSKETDAHFEGFFDLVLDVCAHTIASDERFAQTGTGWVLRDLGASQPDRMLAFVREHLAQFNREGLRYALEKTPKATRAELLAQHKAL